MKLTNKRKANADVDYWNDDSDNDGQTTTAAAAETPQITKKRYKKSAYLSDDEELSDGTGDE